MEGVLNNLLPLTDESNRTRVRLLLENTNKLVTTWTEVAGGDTPKRVKRILANLDRATGAMDKAASSLGKVAHDNAARIATTLASAENAARAISRATQGLQPQKTLTEINKTTRALRARINDPAITQAMNTLSTASRQLSSLSTTLTSTVRRRDRQLGTILGHLEDTIRNLKAFARAIRERPSLLLRGETKKEREVP
jgi:ABC-type transporter Mla subunit MlaD